ncbi:MAG: type II toxin-antitoxin system VapC family toxin [Longimicrobiales bacterium]
MRALLDTHAFIWWSTADSRLGKRATRIIRDSDNELLFSAASAWEIATKHRLGKLREAETILEDLPEALSLSRFEALPISLEHAAEAGSLSGAHRDPFDRMLIAQSRIERIPVVTADPIFKSYDVEVLW